MAHLRRMPISTEEFAWGAPRLKDRRAALLNLLAALLWFTCFAAIFLLGQRTLLDFGRASRAIAIVIAVVAITLKFLSKPWKLDGWSAFIYGFFGLVPLGITLALLANAFIGPVQVVGCKAVGIHHTPVMEGFVIVFDDDRFNDQPMRMRAVERDAIYWRLDSAVFTLRHGLCGFDVLLDRRFVFAPEKPPLEDLR